MFNQKIGQAGLSASEFAARLQEYNQGITTVQPFGKGDLLDTSTRKKVSFETGGIGATLALSGIKLEVAHALGTNEHLAYQLFQSLSEGKTVEATQREFLLLSDALKQTLSLTLSSKAHEHIKSAVGILDTLAMSF